MGEAKPGGLVIFRAPQTRSSSGQTPHSHHPDSQPQSSQPNPEQATLRSKSPKPTALKAKADRAPPPRRTGKGKDRELPASTRSEPELDEDVLQMRTETDALRRQSRSENSIGSVNGSFQFPPARPPRSPHERIHDASQPIPLQETPQIQKNKIMRGETGHRRRSSVSRGKRASSSFENTGVISEYGPLGPLQLFPHSLMSAQLSLIRLWPIQHSTSTST